MNDTIDEPAVTQHALHWSRFDRNRSVGHDNTARIRERTSNQVKARQRDHRVSNAADAEDQNWLSERPSRLCDGGPHSEPAIFGIPLRGGLRSIALRASNCAATNDAQPLRPRASA